MINISKAFRRANGKGKMLTAAVIMYYGLCMEDKLGMVFPSWRTKVSNGKIINNWINNF